jgi:hypothetical protein
MKKDFQTAADKALDEATEAAKLMLADRLVTEAATCDLKTLAKAIEVADLLRDRRQRAVTDALRQQKIELLGDKLPMLLDTLTSLVAGTPRVTAPHPCA